MKTKTANLSSPPGARAWRRFFRSGSARLGLALIGFVAFVSLGADLLSPYRPDFRISGHDLSPPSYSHWLGTDGTEKDVLSRVMHGSRLSLMTGCVSIVLAISIGVPIGLSAGYFGKVTDTLLMRSVDIALAFPAILIALLVATAFSRGWTTVIVAVGLINVPVFARQVRATVLGVKELDYVAASRALGAAQARILWRDILPSIISPVVVLATLGLGSAILEVAALSFLGIAGEPTDPEWGSMLTQAKDGFRRNPWAAIGPGIAISITILGFNLTGDALRDAPDPKLGTPTTKQ